MKTPSIKIKPIGEEVCQKYMKSQMMIKKLRSMKEKKEEKEFEKLLRGKINEQNTF